jgi:hypothetical protein
MSQAGIHAASKIEHANHIKRKLLEFNRMAKGDHKKFRILVNRYFKPGRIIQWTQY